MAKYCKGECTADELSEWAKNEGKHLLGHLGEYARILRGKKGIGGLAAASITARQLGLDPDQMTRRAEKAATVVSSTLEVFHHANDLGLIGLV